MAAMGRYGPESHKRFPHLGVFQLIGESNRQANKIFESFDRGLLRVVEVGDVQGRKTGVPIWARSAPFAGNVISCMAIPMKWLRYSRSNALASKARHSSDT
jgi:hypothetical protein